MMAVALAVMSQPGYQRRIVYEGPRLSSVQPTEATARLIAALSNNSEEARRTARQTLLAMGPEIEPQLRWALDAERRTRPGTDLRQAGLQYSIVELNVLISHFEERRKSGASIVSLHFTDAPFVEILSAFGSQIDATVSISSRPDYSTLDWIPTTRGSLDLDHANYWDALRTIRQSLRLNPLFGLDAHAPTIEFSRMVGGTSPLEDPNAVVAGPLWIAPTAMQREQSEITLTLQAVAEPKVNAGRYGEYATVRLDEVIDDSGRSLLGTGVHPVFTSVSVYPSERRRADLEWKWKVPVRIPSPPSGRRIRTVKGQFGVATGAPGLDIAAVDLKRGGTQSFEWDGVVVTVTSVRQMGTQYVISGEFSAPAFSPMAKAMAEKDSSGWAQENSLTRLHERLGLIDAAGKFLRRDASLGSVRHEGDRDVIAWTLTSWDLPRQLRAQDSCAAPCTPATLTWSADFESRWFTVPFDMNRFPER